VAELMDAGMEKGWRVVVVVVDGGGEERLKF
jgi:hypothetical protein